MASLYLSATRECGKTLFLKPLTSRQASDIDPALRDTGGYFLLEGDGTSTSVLARVDDESSAFKLAGLLGLR